MTFKPLFGTGFETGLIHAPGDWSNGYAPIVTATKKTGAYSFVGRGGFFFRYILPEDVRKNHLYVATWAYNVWHRDGCFGLRVYTASGNFIRFSATGRSGNYGRMALSLDSTYVIYSNYDLELNPWHYFELYAYVATNGIVKARVDGIDYLTYTGNTKKGASEICSIGGFYSDGGDSDVCYMDDFVVGHDDWPNDIRFNVLKPNADTEAADWTPSTGTDQFAVIDDIPPNGTDYLVTNTGEQKTIVEIEDWEPQEQYPVIATMYARTYKPDAKDFRVSLIDSDGINENIETPQPISAASWNYIRKILPKAPDGADWTAARLNALLIGIKSSIPVEIQLQAAQITTTGQELEIT